jgi:light-regulated signal transduction histidine kinase (bacteriophytochrome)
MKPLMSTTDDSERLKDLGRASIQIVHDLRNQLNGLKLYATFLRKRMEKSERPNDEQEAIGKLISGLDRAATDLSTIMQYGESIELKKQSGLDLQEILHLAHSNPSKLGQVVSFESAPGPFKGEFDAELLTEAFKWISVVATGVTQDKAAPRTARVSITRDAGETTTVAIIEWAGLSHLDHDPFRSFVGSDGIRMSLAAKIVETHGGSAEHRENSLFVTLPLSD